MALPRWTVRPDGSNWGDFGADDQIGKMNTLTPAHRRRALSEAREGIVFTLSLPLDYPGGQEVNGNRKPPKLSAGEVHGGGVNYHRCLCSHQPLWLDVTNDDVVTLHTQYSTQWDALSHYGQLFDADADGKPEMCFYNGYRAGPDILHPDAGGPYAKALDIDALARSGVQGRGVLIDLFALHGDAHLRVGYEGLMRAAEQQKVEVEAGDFLCIYTGFADEVLRQSKRPDGAHFRKHFVGLDGADQRLLRWIDDAGIVAVCADNPAVEYVSVKPRSDKPHALLPLHEHCLFKLGIHLGELWWLGELARWLAGNHRSSFLLSAPPLRLSGSVGSPVTPLATV